MPEAAAAPFAESLLVDAVAPTAVDVGLGASMAGGLGGLSTVGGMFGGAGAGLGATGLGGISSLSALPATVAEVSPVAMGQITSALAPTATGSLAGYGLGGAATSLGTGLGAGSTLGLGGAGAGTVLGTGAAGLGEAAISPEIQALQQQLAASQMPQITELGQVAAKELAPEMLQQQTLQNKAITDAISQNVARTGLASSGAGIQGELAQGTADLVGGGVQPTFAESLGGIKDLIGSGIQSGIDFVKENPKTSLAAALAYKALNEKQRGVPAPAQYSGPLSKFQYDPSKFSPTIPAQPTPYQPVYQNYRGYADGGMMDAGANPSMMMQGGNDPLAFQSTGVERMASGGISSLGRYSDGGQMLKGPGDGMSDSIPATIADKQPARLANDEFVVPADVVSHLGNGSSDAGAKQLYSMMNRVRKARTGTTKQGKQINPTKYIPA
jgi:hypothetical protein